MIESVNIEAAENQEIKRTLNDVITSIPKTLYESVYKMESEEEKRMLLYAVTVITGSLMPNVWINYDARVNYPGLMLLISYPAASGKGKLSLLPILVRGIMNEMIGQNTEAMSKYKQDIKVYERAIRNGETKITPPQRPSQMLLLVPGNTTSSKLTEQLYENDGKMMVLLFETEADSFSNMAGNNFGSDNSVIIRKSYHNEPISQMRKLNAEHLVVNCPKMAVVLSGTHSQIPFLFKSTNDGLLSRFLIVKGHAPVKWKDVEPCADCVPLDSHFENQAATFYKMFQFFKNRKVEVKFSSEQWAKINQSGCLRLEETNEDVGEDATSIAKRHANMIVRLASIFSMVRYFEESRNESEVYCNDIDFQNAYWMVEESYQCSLELFKSLSGIKKEENGKLDQFYESLPNEFKIKELAPLKVNFKISDRTINRWLTKLVEGRQLETPKKGYYQKHAVADVANH